MSSPGENHNSTIRINMNKHTVYDPLTNAPYVPSKVEAKHYLYGLPSKPLFIARSSPDLWMKPTGPKVYLDPKDLTPLGKHQLDSEVWEGIMGPAMDTYLLEKQVQYTLLLPVRIGLVGEPSSAVIMVGVNHGALSAEVGIDIAAGCRSILLDNSIDDMHIIIYESRFHRSASLYEPATITDPVAIVREPFSTTLGIPICNAATPNFEGTAGFFIDSAKPGIPYLLTARHVLFHPDGENTNYTSCEHTGQAKKKVMFMGEPAFKVRCEALQSAIGTKELILDHLTDHLAGADNMKGDVKAAAERELVERMIEKAKGVIAAFKKLLTDVTRDWAVKEDRVIGHVSLSPPITLNYGNDGFTDDWAVVQIKSSMISRLNFVGNAIDLGSVDVRKLMAWMCPHTANPTLFKYPIDRLLRFTGTVSDQEMFNPNPKNKDQDDDPVIMVLKTGSISGLTIGRLNTIRAFVREYFKGEPGEMSEEMSVLPRNYKSGPFSDRGDSGSVVTDGKGRVCGIITGGDGATDDSDCTYVTSINFLIKRLVDYKIKADILPLPANL